MQPRSQRSDWQRNHERLLAVAAQVVARDGFEASLEEIARRAGIGSATLHRHFPSRHALLEEIFQDGVDRLCRRAHDLAAEPASGLTAWLEELAVYSAETRGLAASLIAERPDLAEAQGCHGQLLEAAQELVRRACAAGAVRPDVAAMDLLTITNAVSLVSEGDPDTARRLIRLAVDGVKL
ncbi:TetR/AcrR family transcriptional regulator [Nocardia alni]|uniref:TetR/AcrR family transcriptional regulator n=1 Tax=Nocardia alni TaxID=2815723 RepID=UPI001C23D400|nr:TetR/AcrR family transcriptional regulator [Nocardia alni]